MKKLSENRKAEIALSDIIEPNAIQNFQDAFSEAFSLPVVLCDPASNLITRPSNLSSFCKYFFNPDSELFCCRQVFPGYSPQELSDYAVKSIPCAHLSFLMLHTCPISIDGHHKGTLAIIEITDESPSLKELDTLTGPDLLIRSQLQELSGTLKRTDEKILHSARRFMKEVCRQVSEIAHTNLHNSILVAEQELNRKEISKSEKQFESIFRNAADAIFIADKKTGIIIDANHTASILMNMPAEEIIGKHQSELHPEESKQYNHETFNAHRKDLESRNKTAPYENFLLNKNGKKIPVEILAASVTYKGTECMMGTFRDISARKKAESELKIAKDIAEENEARFRSMFELHSALMLLIEPDSGKIIEANEAAIRFYGYPIDQFRTMYIQEINQLNEDEVKEEMEKARAKKLNHFTFPHKLANGTIRVVEVHSTPIKFKGNIILFSILHDITRRKQAEEKILEEKQRAETYEKRLRAIENNLDNGLIFQEVYDENNPRRFIYVSNIVTKFYGCKVEHALEDPENIYSRIYKQDRTQLMLDQQQALKKMTSVDREIRVKNPDGTTRWSRYLSRPIRDGNKVIWNGIEIDITDLWKSRNEYLKAKEKAEESDRLKTVFLENISHEIRTPLNAICGFSNRLGKPDLSPEKRKSFTTIINQSSRQLLAIIDDILTISSLVTKQTNLHISEFSLNEVIYTVEQIFMNQAREKDLDFVAHTELETGKDRIKGDKTKIIQILSNLITNALKFTDKGYVHIGYELKRTQLHFFVKDSGIGIKSGQLENIFNRFTQEDDQIRVNYGGTGLGLSISKGFAELMGGEINVESNKGKGSVFTLVLPYYPPGRETNIIVGKDKMGKFEKELLILVAEDEINNYLYLEELLSERNCTLIHAATGKETVELFKKHPNTDLILMDIKMPEMDGFEAAKIIKNISADIPIIAQTAYATQNEKEKYITVFDDYLIKPIAEEILLKTILKFIEKERKE